MNDPVLIRLKGGAADYNLELGFIPKFVKVTIMSGTNPDRYEWFGEMMEDSAEAIADSWEYGIKRVGADGIETYMDTVAKGISAYDGAKTPQILVSSPKPGAADEKTTITGDYTVARSTAATARTATAVGTILRPTTHNGYVYECTTAGTGSAEPTWPTTPGDTVTDGTTVFTCREENIVSNKGLGITLGGTLLEDNKIVYVEAYKAIRCEDIGDIG